MDGIRRMRPLLAGGALLSVLWAGGPTLGADPPVTLRLATVSGEDGPTADLIRAFGQAVAAASQGSVIVEPWWGANGDNPNGGDDQVLVRRVADGSADLVLAPSRGFDDSGTVALQALQTPYMIDDDALALAVATGPVGDRALASLEPAGLVGLALWSDGLRHPITFSSRAEPFLVPGDLAGEPIRAVTSAVTWDLLRAYGAEPSQKNHFQDSDYAGEEGSLAGRGEGGRIATGDVTFFPRYQVLAMDAAVFSRLTDVQRDALRSGASAMRDTAIAAHVPEADAAAGFCADGGRVVLAGKDAVAAFQDAARPIIERLEQDPVTSDLVAAIRELKAATRPAPGARACEPAPLPTAPAVAAWTPVVAPDGVYRAAMTAAEVGDASAGVWTWAITDGETVLTHSAAPGRECRPTTELTDDAWRLTFPADGYCLQEVADLRWEPAEGGIRVTLTRILPASLYPIESPWYDRFWKRIE